MNISDEIIYTNIWRFIRWDLLAVSVIDRTFRGLSDKWSTFSKSPLYYVIVWKLAVAVLQCCSVVAELWSCGAVEFRSLCFGLVHIASAHGAVRKGRSQWQPILSSNPAHIERTTSRRTAARSVCTGLELRMGRQYQYHSLILTLEWAAFRRGGPLSPRSYALSPSPTPF